MTLISSNIKTNILKKLDDIINIEDPNWTNLKIDIKYKIIHNLCNYLKNNKNLQMEQMEQIDTINSLDPVNSTNLITTINIPLKSQRPKKIIQLCGINKQTNFKLFDEFRKEQLTINVEFRKTYNSKNKNYCFANLSKLKYASILNDYNNNIYKFINKNIDLINCNNLFNNLIAGNQQKIINLSNDNSIDHVLKIVKLTQINELLIIEFNNNIIIQMELFLTSEKITSNIPAKYKIFLKNIF